MTLKILIVEDEPAIAELIAINLTHAGFEVERAFQADQAVLMMKDTLPQLLILDWMLPGKSGVQFAKELRSNPKTNALPILMLTAKGEEGKTESGQRQGTKEGRRARLTGKMKILYCIILNIHTHTHTQFSEYRLFWISLSLS